MAAFEGFVAAQREPLRTILRLRYLDGWGFSWLNLSVVTGLTEGALRTRTYRAMKEFRSHLAASLHGRPVGM